MLAVLALSGTARADEVPSCQTFNDSRVLLIGDSHTVKSPCEAYPRWDADARQGRWSEQALEALDARLRPRHTKVVFDIATNDVFDSDRYRDNLRLLWQMIGDRKLVLVTTCANSVQPSVDDEIRSFVAAHPQRSSYVAWGEYACGHPELFGPDNIHFTAEGYEQRVGMVKDGARVLVRGHRGHGGACVRRHRDGCQRGVGAGTGRNA